MKRILYLFFFIVVACTIGNAQQENQYTHFMYTKQMINPGYVGSKGMPSFLGLYRRQWIGFDGAPTSQLLAFNTPFYDPRVGFGVTVSHHQTGDIEQYLASLAYSYDMINEDNLNLRFGIMGTIQRLSIDLLRPGSVIRDPSDPNINHVLAEFPRVNGNVGAGLYLNVKGAYVGVSVPNILSNQLGISGTTAAAEEKPHFYIMGGAIAQIPESQFQIYPNILFKFVENAPFSVDLNLSAIYNNVFTFGLSYRYGDTNSDSIDFLAHFQATKEFGIGVAYDIPISDIREFNSGSIELLLSYNIGKKNPDMTNPRFFF